MRARTLCTAALVAVSTGMAVILLLLREPWVDTVDSAAARDGAGGLGRSSASLRSADTATAPAAVSRQPAPSHTAEASVLAAVRSGDVRLLRRLLAAGASPDATDGEGVSALAHAIEAQQDEAVHALLEAGASLGSPPGVEPILVTAIRAGDETLALDLLQRGAPVNSIDGQADSPLVAAAAAGADQLIAALLAAGADVNAPDGNGETPLASAVGAGNPESVAALLALGARVDVPGADGLSPLQLAVDSGAAEIADMLRRAGARD